MSTADSNRARQRLTTTVATGGMRVRMKPEGLRALAKRGNVETLRHQIPMLEADQLAELLALVDPGVRKQLQGVSPAPPRRGRPPSAPAEASPVAGARARANAGQPMTKHELAQRLGVGDGAVGNVEARGLGATPPTIARYLQPTGARLELVVTHADGYEERYPVDPGAAG